jgi:hypothetical protein
MGSGGGAGTAKVKIGTDSYSASSTNGVAGSDGTAGDAGSTDIAEYGV